MEEILPQSLKHSAALESEEVVVSYEKCSRKGIFDLTWNLSKSIN